MNNAIRDPVLVLQKMQVPTMFKTEIQPYHLLFVSVKRNNAAESIGVAIAIDGTVFAQGRLKADFSPSSEYEMFVWRFDESPVLPTSVAIFISGAVVKVTDKPKWGDQ